VEVENSFESPALENDGNEKIDELPENIKRE
jgi:hypothetical protein